MSRYVPLAERHRRYVNRVYRYLIDWFGTKTLAWLIHRQAWGKIGDVEDERVGSDLQDHEIRRWGDGLRT